MKMDSRNIKAAYESLNEDEELYLRYIDGNYSCTITAQDDAIFGWANDVHIRNKQVWIDASNICFMKTRKVEK